MFNVCVGTAETAQYLIKHPLIRKISITGSTKAGVSVLSSSSTRAKPTTMELGGKSPLVVLKGER